MNSTVESAETLLGDLASLLRGEIPEREISWQAILGAARRHRVSPLLFWRLRVLNVPDDLLPVAVQQALRNDYHTAVVRGMLLQHELVRILKALNRAHVPALLLKGAALARTVYPDPMLRTMGDVDLLVSRECVERARGALESLGYVYVPEPPQRLNPFNTAFTGEMSFRRTAEKGATLVDLHWELFAIEAVRLGAAIDVQALWKGAELLHIGEAEALVLSPEDALMHVCLHIAMHGFTFVRGYGDIAQIADKGVDWAVFAQRVRDSRIRVACYFPLWWAWRVWRAPVPDRVLRVLRPDPLRVALGRWMTARGTVLRTGSGHAWEHLVHMFAIDRVRDLARVLAWLFFPGPTWLRERYRLRSALQVWAWVVVHPHVVLWEGLRSLAVLVGQLAGLRRPERKRARPRLDPR